MFSWIMNTFCNQTGWNLKKMCIFSKKIAKMGDFRLSIFHRKFLELHVFKVDLLAFNIKRDLFVANGAKKLSNWNYFSLFTTIKCIRHDFRIFANLLINTYYLWCRAQYLMFGQINLNKKKFGHHTKLVGWHTSIINTILMFGYPKHTPSSPPPPEKWNMLKNALILGVLLLKMSEIFTNRYEIYERKHLPRCQQSKTN